MEEDGGGEEGDRQRLAGGEPKEETRSFSAARAQQDVLRRAGGNLQDGVCAAG